MASLRDAVRAKATERTWSQGVSLARDGRVLKVEQALPPWRMAGRRGAHAVVELPAGEVARRGLRVGDTLTVAGGGDR